METSSSEHGDGQAAGPLRTHCLQEAPGVRWILGELSLFPQELHAYCLELERGREEKGLLVSLTIMSTLEKTISHSQSLRHSPLLGDPWALCSSGRF